MVQRNNRSGGRRASAGFTLVELMVVISIIGMLMALLLPAVQGARETGRRNTCQSNQKNVAFALQQYNDTKKCFPGWNNWLSSAANTTNLSGNLQYGEVTYVVPLLPFLERTDVYNNYTQYLNSLLSGSTNSNQQIALGSSQVYMALLVCPSNPPITQVGATPLAYVINGGQIDTGGNPVTQSATVYTTASQIQSVAAASGIAYDQTGITDITIGSGASAVTVPGVRVSQDYVNSHDGTAYTLLLSENTLSSSSWSLLANNQGGAPTISPSYSTVLSGPTVAPLQQIATTFMWANSTTTGLSTPPSGYFPINGDKINNAAIDIKHARPASNHNGVSVFSFCGGNVRPIAEDIDYRIFKQLMTPSGGASITGSPPTISGSGDFDSQFTVLDESKY